MDFSLSKEQQQIVKAAREFALREFPERALEFDRTETFDLALWKKASALGFVGVFISFILVPTAAAGYQAVKIRGKLGIRASDTAELVLKDLRVPAENLVGRAGEGFSQLMAFFNNTRIHVCAQAVGLSRAALEEAVRHVNGRVQFGQPLAAFQATQFKIAEMATRIRAARNLYYEAAWGADRGRPDHGLVAMAKWFSGQTAVFCADEALQLHGGYGYIDAYKVQRLYRDAKILEIYEGSKEIEKLNVARSLLR
jgi:hypothetical protein